jgi:peptidoglycan hydrolase CwlO-like protein
LVKLEYIAIKLFTLAIGEGVKGVFISSRMKSILALGLVISFVSALFCTSIVVGQAEPPSGIQEKLKGISEEEKQVLQNLFTLAQEIAVMETQETELAEYIDKSNQELISIEAAIASEEANFAKKQEALKRVLNIYQKMGPGSYLEIIMDSDSLSAFLRRINTLRDLTRNTGELLKMLETSKDKLSLEKVKLVETLALIKEKQEQSKEALANKLKLKKDQEAYLSSLKEKSGFYQEHLSNIKGMLEELKPLIEKAAKEFSSIISNGSLPEDAFKMTISLFNIKATIDQKTFNEIISKHPNLSMMVFEFNTDEIEIRMPERNLALSGAFVIQGGNILRFQAEKGSFYGMPLEPGYIKELLGEEGIALDFKPLLDKSTLQSIKLQDGYIELNIKLNIF